MTTRRNVRTTIPREKGYDGYFLVVVVLVVLLLAAVVELLDSGSLLYSLTLEGAKGLAVMVDNTGSLDFETATRLNLREDRKHVMVIIEIMP